MVPEPLKEFRYHVIKRREGSAFDTIDGEDTYKSAMEALKWHKQDDPSGDYSVIDNIKVKTIK